MFLRQLFLFGSLPGDHVAANVQNCDGGARSELVDPAPPSAQGGHSAFSDRDRAIPLREP